MYMYVVTIQIIIIIIYNYVYIEKGATIFKTFVEGYVFIYFLVAIFYRKKCLDLKEAKNKYLILQFSTKTFGRI